MGGGMRVSNGSVATQREELLPTNYPKNLGPIWVHNLPNTVHYRAVRCRTELDESST